MKDLLEREVLIELVRKIQDCNGTEKEQDELVEQVEDGVLDPQISGYIFWSEMTAEEIVPIPTAEELNSKVWGDGFCALIIEKEDFDNVWNCHFHRL